MARYALMIDTSAEEDLALQDYLTRTEHPTLTDLQALEGVVRGWLSYQVEYRQRTQARQLAETVQTLSAEDQAKLQLELDRITAQKGEELAGAAGVLKE